MILFVCDGCGELREPRLNEPVSEVSLPLGFRIEEGRLYCTHCVTTGHEETR